MIKCPDCCDGYDWYEHPECTVRDYCIHGGRCFRKYNECERCKGTGEILPTCPFCGEPNTREGAKEDDDCEACINAPKCFSCGDPLIGNDSIKEIYIQKGGMLDGRLSQVEICKTCDNRNHEAARELMASFSQEGAK